MKKNLLTKTILPILFCAALLMTSGDLPSATAEDSNAPGSFSKTAASSFPRQELRLNVENTNLILKETETDQIQSDHNPLYTKFETSFNESSTALTVSAVGTGEVTPLNALIRKLQSFLQRSSKPNNSFNMVTVQIPAGVYSSVVVNAKRSGVSLPRMNADIHAVNENGSMGITLPSGYDKTLNFKLINGSGGVSLEDADSFRLVMNARGSAVSVPESWPDFFLNTNYEYQRGSKAGTVLIELDQASFSLTDR